MPRTRKCAFLAMLIGAVLVETPALAESTVPSRWICKANSGECIGRVAMTVRKSRWKNAAGIWVLASYPNGEFSFDDTLPSGERKLIHFPRAEAYAFSWTTTNEDEREFETRYQQGAGRAIYYVMGSLIGSFPEGEDALPEEWQTRKQDMDDGRMVLSVTVKKSGYRKALFKIEETYRGGSPSRPVIDIEGEWDFSKPPRLPDSMVLDGWTFANRPAPVTLGMLRTLIAPARR